MSAGATLAHREPPISIDDLNALVAERNMADAQARKEIGLDPVRLEREARRRAGAQARPKVRYSGQGRPAPPPPRPGPPRLEELAVAVTPEPVEPSA